MTAIHYRYCSRDLPTIASASLYEALREVLSGQTEDGRPIRQSISARKQRCTDDHDVVMSVFTRTPDWIFVELLRAEPGAFMVTVQDDGNDETVSIRQYRTPDDHSPHRGSLYAVIHRDHVVFATKGYFSSRCLEDYLTWFCRKRADILSDENRVALATRTPNIQRLRANSVRLSMSPLEPVDFMPDDEDAAPVVRRPTSQGLLDTLLVADADLRQLVEGGELEVDVLLKFKSGRLRRDMPVGDLNRIFRNIDDVEDLTFDGPNGPISALGARLRANRAIQSAGSVLDTTDARRKLIEQFDEWREQGLIADDQR